MTNRDPMFWWRQNHVPWTPSEQELAEMRAELTEALKRPMALTLAPDPPVIMPRYTSTKEAVVMETYEWVLAKLSRFWCRVFKIHSRYCRGRRDHVPGAGIWVS